jgi:hypothetical protein
MIINKYIQMLLNDRKAHQETEDQKGYYDQQ